MEQTRFPLLEEHRAIHQELLTKASGFLADHDDGSIIFRSSCWTLCASGLKTHVKVEDKEIHGLDERARSPIAAGALKALIGSGAGRVSPGVRMGGQEKVSGPRRLSTIM